MAFFLGIDGGGTKTACAIGDATSVLGTGSSSGSNVVRVGEARARAALQAAIRDASQAAGVALSQIDRACIGVAGAARPEIRDLIARQIGEIIPGGIEVVGDMEIAQEAAFAAGPGVIVIAGTGSIAFGRNAAGQTARAGGWGHAISDEGSGHWIGRMAVAAAVEEGDQSRDTCLLKLIAKSWGVNTHHEVVVAANAAPAPEFAALLPVVLKAADKKNRQALAVLGAAGEKLAGLATDVIERLFADAITIPVAMSGGVFANSSLVREVFYNSLNAARPGIQLNPFVVEPVLGALQRARRALAGENVHST